MARCRWSASPGTATCGRSRPAERLASSQYLGNRLGGNKPRMERNMVGRAPTIIDLNAEAAKLTMLRGRTPQTTFAARRARGSSVHLGRYRDGMLLLARSAGKSHWETHPEDELLYVLDGEMTVDIVEKDGPRSFVVGACMIATVPSGAWRRVRSAYGMMVASATRRR